MSGSLALLFVLSACTRTAIPLNSDQTALTATAFTQQELDAIPLETEGEYAVVWIPLEEKLRVYNPAGITGNLMDELPYDQGGIHLTGNSTALGSSQWVEITIMGDDPGWVNAWNLTESIDPAIFCNDPQVLIRLQELEDAFEREDGNLLAQGINPSRGLIIRHDWWNPEVIIPQDSIPNLFQDFHEIDWGVLSGGDFQILGSFKDVLYPSLATALQEDQNPVCNVLPSGTTSLEAVWPSEYSSLNYYAFHLPALEDGNQFDWQTWVVGFEYIGGVPYITLLLQYRGDV
jgi:hypothetical protein